MQPTQSSMFCRTSAGTSPRVTTSETANRPPGFKTRNASRNTRSLSRGQVDDAIGDDHIDRVVGQGDVFDFAFQKLHILDAGLALVLAGERQHFIGHIEAVGFAGRADAPRREQHVDAAAGAEIEHRFARIELRQRRGIAAAERSEYAPLPAARRFARRRRGSR